MRTVKLFSIVILVFLAFPLVPGGYVCVERPASGGTSIVTLDVCHQGQGGIASQNMLFVVECADTLVHMDCAHPFNYYEQACKAFSLSNSKDRPPSSNPYS